jgi:hypothetical protein
VLFRSVFEALLRLISSQNTALSRERVVCYYLPLLLEAAPLFDEAELHAGFFVDRSSFPENFMKSFLIVL